MAQTKKSTSSRGRKPAGRSASVNSNRNYRQEEKINDALVNEIVMIVVIAFSLFLFLCNIFSDGGSILGSIGTFISDFLFGVFGFLNYIIPIMLIYVIFLGIANSRSPKAIRRIICIIVLYICISMFCELISNTPNVDNGFSVSGDAGVYQFAADNHTGGGLIAGSLCFLSVKGLGNVGTIFLLIVILIITLVLLTEKSFFNGVRKVSETSRRAFEKNQEEIDNRRERRVIRNEERIRRKESLRLDREERLNEKRIRQESKEDNKLLRGIEVSGVPTYSFAVEENKEAELKNRDDIHEINLNNMDEILADNNIGYMNEQHFEDFSANNDVIQPTYLTQEDFSINNAGDSDDLLVNDDYVDDGFHEITFNNGGVDDSIPTGFDNEVNSLDKSDLNSFRNSNVTSSTFEKPKAEITKKVSKPSKPYRKPPIDLLQKGKSSKGNDKNELMQTAKKLEAVLQSFNVKARVTDVSQGPAVTRYEMIPETGVKVSKILSLQDDIKLNLAAQDIRIEAPIPGKAAIGIEVPNKESSSVSLRELLESKEFNDAESMLSFGTGKDLAGKVVVSDIAKMPHVLIAGATGSGKSVCINTLIISILYKATPQDVKMIMIDPKVVELSVYNGIPHLLIPVVTDPKKANASLQWAVKEMDDRYQKFAEMGVRGLKGYNDKIKDKVDENGVPIPKMYQLVVIVDELADLMMVAGKEVEESICRLAQLARAAGIHLVIATQRPSVDVITGLIKANMPSRIAFSVSSGVDSRTILDMNGAEKLLGKGDMLFYPSGYTKPARVQGAFVSDKEVSDVVDYLKQFNNEPINDEIQEKILSMTKSDSNHGGPASTGETDGQDEYFYEAGRLITQTGKSSIGMLQRKFKIGFNRAARIMDALADANVVGPEEGTKPRTVLMSPEQFEDQFG